MEIDFETWKQLVEGAKITKAELRRPNSLFLEFDTGMVCYVYVDADTPLEFDFNWLKGFEFLAKPALKIYMESMMRKGGDNPR